MGKRGASEPRSVQVLVNGAPVSPPAPFDVQFGSDPGAYYEFTPLQLFSDVFSDGAFLNEREEMAGSTLTVAIDNAETTDRVSLRSNSSIALEGSGLFYRGIQIATFGGGMGREPLVIAFHEGATGFDVRLVIYLVEYQSISQFPTKFTRNVQWTVTSGDGATARGDTQFDIQHRPRDVRLEGIKAFSFGLQDGNPPVFPGRSLSMPTAPILKEAILLSNWSIGPSLPPYFC